MFFHLTIFLSAFLLFVIQPLEGNLVLPLFGGAPSVWVVTLVFYQLVLFLGYVAAHLLSQHLRPRAHLLFHIVFLTAAYLTLNLIPSSPGNEALITSPIQALFILLTSHVGFAFFVLSMTSPLIQRWLSWTNSAAHVYRLYATSNAGSLLALIIYPAICEPFLPLSVQAHWWGRLFLVFSLCCAVCALSVYQSLSKSGRPANSSPIEIEARVSLSGTTRLFWFLLSMCSSMFLTSITNLMCNQLSSVPFVFLVPLSVYLLTFIFAFSVEQFRFTARRGIITILVVGVIFGILLWRSSLFVQTAFIYGVLLAAVCLTCHITLYRTRPPHALLTTYYVLISAGGAVGSLTVAIIAPLVFTRYYEIPLTFVLFGVLLSYYMVTQVGYASRNHRERGIILVLCCVFSILIPALTTAITKPPGSPVVHEARNFFGQISVSIKERESKEKAILVAHHGMTIHGAQRLAPKHHLDPITYYGPGSGIWAAFEALKDNHPLRVGAVGLASGCIVSYRGEGDYFRFYEINQNAIDIAARQFTFLRNTPVHSEIILGDARLALEQEDDNNFDLIILDAFVGGAIPVHLLTEEIFRTYDRHLSNNGIIAIHISNHFLDLRPVITSVAEAHGFSSVTIDSASKDDYLTPSRWMLLTKSTEMFDREPFLTMRKEKRLEDPPPGKRLLWSDDFHDLLSILMW